MGEAEEKKNQGYQLFAFGPSLYLDAFNGLSIVGHLKLAHLDLQSLNSFAFRGLRHVQVSIYDEPNP